MKISIISATYNCERDIRSLISCLESIQDDNFEWIIIDGGSKDRTVDLVREAQINNKTIVSERDFGIYDALNKGISLSVGKYYIVLGADDLIYPDALRNFRNELQIGNFDFVAASVKAGKNFLLSGQGGYWRRGGNAFIAGHAVGTLIKKSTHEKYGMYKNKYPNCADMHFIATSIIKHKKTIHYANFVAGEFGCEGLSSVDRVASITDAYRIYLDLGGSRLIGTFIMLYRLIRLNK